MFEIMNLVEPGFDLLVGCTKPHGPLEQNNPPRLPSFPFLQALLQTLLQAFLQTLLEALLPTLFDERLNG